MRKENVKKLLSLFTLAMCLGMVLAIVTVVSNANRVRRDYVFVGIDGRQIATEAFGEIAPYINEDNRVLIPVRFVAEYLGFDVGWDESTRTVTISGETPQGLDQEIKLVIGERSVERRKEGNIQMDTVPIIENGRTMVPLRFVSEAMGMQVVWDTRMGNVAISSRLYEPGFETNADELFVDGFTLDGFEHRHGLMDSTGFVHKVHGEDLRFNLAFTLNDSHSDLTIVTNKPNLEVRREIRKIFKKYYPTEYEEVYRHFMETVKQENWQDEKIGYTAEGYFNNRSFYVNMSIYRGLPDIVIVIGRFGAGGQERWITDISSTMRQSLDKLYQEFTLVGEEKEEYFKEMQLDVYK